MITCEVATVLNFRLFIVQTVHFLYSTLLESTLLLDASLS